MAAKINIEVSGYPQGSPGDPVVHPYSIVDGASPTVNLSLTDDTGVTEYFWSFLSRPTGSTASISGATTATPSFTLDADLAGSYLISCSLNNGATTLTNGLGITTEVLEVRIPSARETVEFEPIVGWDATMQDFMRKVDAQILVSGDSYWDRVDGSGSGGSGYYLSPLLSERVQVPDGSRAAPSVVFAGDIDTGFWAPSAGVISTSIGGTPGVQLRRSGSELFFETYDVDSAADIFHVRHESLTSGNASQLIVEAIGNNSNDGASAYLGARAGAGAGDGELELEASGGTSSQIVIGSTAYNAGDSNIDVEASTTGNSTIDVGSRSTGSGLASLRLVAESSGYGAILTLGCKGAIGATPDEGLIQIGEYDTGKIAFLSSDIYGSTSWTGTYVYLIEDPTELDDFFSAFGEVSLISALSSVGASYWQRAATVVSPATAGDTVRVGAGSETDVGLGFEGTNNTGFYQKSATEIGVAVNGSTDSFFGRSEIGGTYGDRPAFMGEEPIGIVSYSNDSANAGAGDLYLAAHRQAASPTTPGEAIVWIEALNDNVAGTGSTVTVRAQAIETDAFVEIYSHISGTTLESVLSTVEIYAYNSSTSNYTDALVNIYAEAINEGVGRVLLGNANTEDIGITDIGYDLSGIAWSDGYLNLGGGSSDWVMYDEIWGQRSLLSTLNHLYNGFHYRKYTSTPFQPTSNAVTVDCSYGTIFDIEVTENINTITFTNTSGNLGITNNGRIWYLRLEFTGSYTVDISGIDGAEFEPGETDIVGSNGEFYIIRVEQLSYYTRYCTIHGPFSA